MIQHTGSDGVRGTHSEATIVSEKFLQTSTEPLTTLHTLIGTLLTAWTRDRTLSVDHSVHQTHWLTNNNSKGKNMDNQSINQIRHLHVVT